MGDINKEDIRMDNYPQNAPFILGSLTYPHGLELAYTLINHSLVFSCKPTVSLNIFTGLANKPFTLSISQIEARLSLIPDPHLRCQNSSGEPVSLVPSIQNLLVLNGNSCTWLLSLLNYSRLLLWFQCLPHFQLYLCSILCSPSGHTWSYQAHIPKEIQCLSLYLSKRGIYFLSNLGIVTCSIFLPLPYLLCLISHQVLAPFFIVPLKKKKKG